VKIELLPYGSCPDWENVQLVVPILNLNLYPIMISDMHSFKNIALVMKYFMAISLVGVACFIYLKK